MAKHAGRAHTGWWGACLLKGITASAALEPVSPGEASLVASATYRAGTWGSGTAPSIPLRSSDTGESFCENSGHHRCPMPAPVGD